MPRLLQPLIRAVTYTRWLHLVVAVILPLIMAMVFPGLVDPSPADWALIALQPVPLLVLLAALVPSVRTAEGLQARLMLFPGPHARAGRGRPDDDHGISAAPSASWHDRLRTGVWLVLRLEAGFAVAMVSNAAGGLCLALLGAAFGDTELTTAYRVPGTGWWYGTLVVVVLAVLLAFVTVAGALTARAARALLGPSARERLALLEERTERLLERNRIARELHDSIGHALTLAVVQAGAARAAGDPRFTEQALGAIEETGRAALEDLERVLVVLRDPARPAGSRPDLREADRLLESARSSGARVDAEVSGPLEKVPGPVSREGYRMLQEALTNAVRHAGSLPVGVRIAVEGARLRIEVRNPLPEEGSTSGLRGGGTGVRGIRERAALLGGEACAGPEGGVWRLRVDLPLG
ncbi:histidine kinase [Streptomyces sp. MJP52]|uniref:sensor histidine kinase n=1 Tax=Streptomyces sp. MJP52 TaxID=2940555 RepID=UPI002473DCA2|nr:histidine kinase [Streptomyces sp. MJP52]MDH6228597.1 signal transduction histidine kinase [Streptomyces sp. MJP52]